MKSTNILTDLKKWLNFEENNFFLYHKIMSCVYLTIKMFIKLVFA